MQVPSTVKRFSLVLGGLVLSGALLVAQPPAPLGSYAYLDCSPSNTVTTRIVLVQGVVPATMPATPPRPSIEIVVHAPADKLPSGQQTVSPEGVKSGPNVAMVSCPIVGDCAAARSGTLSVQRAADGRITGDYNGQWSQGQPRVGKFSAVWRDSQKKCG